MRDQIILGVDPGTAVTGYGIIQVSGSAITLIKHGVIETGKGDDHPMKLKVIFEGILAIIDQYNPDELAIEAPFFGKNVQSMLERRSNCVLERARQSARRIYGSRTLPKYSNYRIFSQKNKTIHHRKWQRLKRAGGGHVATIIKV